MNRGKVYTIVIGVASFLYWYLTPIATPSTNIVNTGVSEIEQCREGEGEVENLELILDSWESYTPNLINIPELSKIRGMREAKKGSISGSNSTYLMGYLVEALSKEDMHPELPRVLESLNPYKAGVKDVFKSGWDMGYGITQINLKLVPLANLKYPDFEDNPLSQIRFLNDYIKVKESKSKSIDNIVSEYKYCNVN